MVHFTAQAAARGFQKLEGSSNFKYGCLIFTASVSSKIVNYSFKQAAYSVSNATVVRVDK